MFAGLSSADEPTCVLYRAWRIHTRVQYQPEVASDSWVVCSCGRNRYCSRGKCNRAVSGPLGNCVRRPRYNLAHRDCHEEPIAREDGRTRAKQGRPAQPSHNAWQDAGQKVGGGRTGSSCRAPCQGRALGRGIQRRQASHPWRLIQQLLTLVLPGIAALAPERQPFRLSQQRALVPPLNHPLHDQEEWEEKPPWLS